MSGHGVNESTQALSMHLRRADALVRAQVVRWQALIADGRHPSNWGMVLVDHSEVKRYLEAPFSWPTTVSPHVPVHYEEYLTHSIRMQADIEHLRGQVACDRVDYLRQELGLLDIEVTILMLAVLPEIDPRYRRVYGYLMDDVSQSLPSAGLLMEMVEAESPSAEVLRQVFNGPMVEHEILIVLGSADSAVGLSGRSVRIDDRALSFLLGGDAPDERLARSVEVVGSLR